MTIGTFISQIMTQAGEPGNLSRSLLLRLISEEMISVSMYFPETRALQCTVDDSPADLGLSFEWASGNGDILHLPATAVVRPKSVLGDGVTYRKIYASDMSQAQSVGVSVGNYWAVVNGRIETIGSASEYTVIGEAVPLNWAEMDEEYTGGDYSGAELELEDATGPYFGIGADLMGLVFYRVLQRASEALGAFDKAQYYLQVADKKERDMRRVWTPDSTSSIGYVTADDL